MARGETHYGFIWASMTSNEQGGPSLTIQGYGYETVADSSITPMGVVGVRDKNNEKAEVYSFGKTIHIKSDKVASVQVYNLAGQEVYSGVTKGTIDRIDMRSHSGMHIVKVGGSSKKVFIN